MKFEISGAKGQNYQIHWRSFISEKLYGILNVTKFFYCKTYSCIHCKTCCNLKEAIKYSCSGEIIRYDKFDSLKCLDFDILSNRFIQNISKNKY